MSGHSKWHTIQKQKSATDAKRAQIFTRVARAITVAAKEGGGADLDSNFKLRIAVQQAKAANMPKDNIQRAIDRGIGGGDAGALIENVYEAIGPGGVGIVIETVTDNKNRTVAELKSLLSKNGASMADPGSIMWQFERKGVLRLTDPSKITDRDIFELTVIDAGADDIQDDDSGLTITCPMGVFQKVAEAISGLGIEPDEAGLEYVPTSTIPVDESVSDKLMRIYDVIDDHEDVNNIYNNEG